MAASNKLDVEYCVWRGQQRESNTMNAPNLHIGSLLFLPALLSLCSCASVRNTYRPVERTRVTPQTSYRAAVVPTENSTDRNYKYPGKPGYPLDEKSWTDGYTRIIRSTLANSGFFRDVEIVPETPSKSADSKYDMVFNSELLDVKTGSHPNPLTFIFPPSLLFLVGLPTGIGQEYARQQVAVDAYNPRSGQVLWRFDSGPVERKGMSWVSLWGINNVASGQNRENWSHELTRTVHQKLDTEWQHAIRDGLADKIAALTPSTSPSPIVKVAGANHRHDSDSTRPRNRWAVCVGISRYRSSGVGGLTDLPFAASDARMFSQWLLRAGWSPDHIKCLTDENATERNVRILLESWLTKATANDVIVLYWAGHGFPDPEDPERVYFACHDTDVRIPATGYRMDRIRSTLGERNVRNVVLLADTCHAGKLVTRGGRGLSVVPSLKRMQKENSVPKGWVFMVSAEADRQAVEHSKWKNGAFTHCLLKGLGGNADGFQSAGRKDGTVTLGELRAYLTTAMPDETQKVLGVAKHPLITTSTGDPDIWNLTLEAK